MRRIPAAGPAGERGLERGADPQQALVAVGRPDELQAHGHAALPPPAGEDEARQAAEVGGRAAQHLAVALRAVDRRVFGRRLPRHGGREQRVEAVKAIEEALAKKAAELLRADVSGGRQRVAQLQLRAGLLGQRLRVLVEKPPQDHARLRQQHVKQGLSRFRKRLDLDLLHLGAPVAQSVTSGLHARAYAGRGRVVVPERRDEPEAEAA